MPRPEVMRLSERLAKCENLAGRFLSDAEQPISLAQLMGGTALRRRRSELRGRSVLLATREQLPTALALIELDGVARRLVICPHDLAEEHLASVSTKTDVDAVVCDEDVGASTLRCRVTVGSAVADSPIAPAPIETEWVLLTSGTTGNPKAVVHTLPGLAGAIAANTADTGRIWGTFYDIRRYGGLQIFLRAILAGGSLILSSHKETIHDHLVRLSRQGVTHISGTPSHWRRVLMSVGAKLIAPRYIRLSGEIADQALLDQLRQAFPQSAIVHAYASTEAGVGFEVTDGLEGFPAKVLDTHDGGADLKVENDLLRIRSPRTAVRYLGDDTLRFDTEGYVDTGDIVERRDDRFYFVGRRGGIINVGGFKVHPEEVEAVINRHPAVHMSRVRPKRSPIVGAIIVADVVTNAPGERVAGEEKKRLQGEILDICRGTLAHYKIPAVIQFVPNLDINTSGKIARNNA